MEAKCDPIGFNRTGEVSGGFVTLYGLFIELTFARFALRKEGFYPSAIILIDAYEVSETKKATPVYCLSMLQYAKPTMHMALVLIKSAAQPEGFERIGVTIEAPAAWFQNAAIREVTIF
jgi:hypothetical protein